jgi:hypothetical protein
MRAGVGAVELATKVTQILERPDGSFVRIVAEAGARAYVHRRQSPEHEWVLCSDQPHPDWRTMSVDEYIKRGRSEMLRTVTHGEILKVASMIGKPMSYFN